MAFRSHRSPLSPARWPNRRPTPQRWAAQLASSRPLEAAAAATKRSRAPIWTLSPTTQALSFSLAFSAATFCLPFVLLHFCLPTSERQQFLFLLSFFLCCTSCTYLKNWISPLNEHFIASCKLMAESYPLMMMMIRLFVCQLRKSSVWFIVPLFDPPEAITTKLLFAFLIYVTMRSGCWLLIAYSCVVHR